MEYNTPELVVVGSASALVLGKPPAEDDNGTSQTSRPALGIILGFDE